MSIVAKPVVLIIEDDTEMNAFLSDILSAEYQTESAFNGQEGLEKAVQLKPDLILSDLTMPVMTGDQMFHSLQSMPELASIPVVILSAKGDEALRMRLLDEGVRDYVGKPFAIAEVRSRVRNLVEMRRAVKLREEILGIVSHDLKTPLTSIRLRTQLLSRAFIGSPEQNQIEKYAALTENSIKQMERLIGDLLDFAKIQSGTLSLNGGDHEVAQLLDEGVRLIQQLADAKQIRVLIKLEQCLPKLHCDAGRVLQVLSNILGNAIKFSPSDSVIVVAAITRESEILFSVTDNGPGISEENQSRIFDQYWQAKETARFGTGLGLFIAKGIVTCHGGKLWVESRVGAGSTFFFTLPKEKI